MSAHSVGRNSNVVVLYPNNTGTVW